MERSRALSRQPRLADGDDVVARGQLFLDPAVEILVLEEEHAIVVPDGRLDQTLGIARRGRIDDLEPRGVQESGLGVLRMERSASHVAAAGTAHHHGTGQERPVTRGGHVVGEHVVGAGDEVDELHLADRTHSHMGRARGRAHDRRLGERRVDHPLLAEASLQPFGHLERAAIAADVLAQADDLRVSLHLLE